MAPFDGVNSEGGKKPPAGNQLPVSLKIAFTKAADAPRIAGIFDPAVKSIYDPQNYVSKHIEPAFSNAVAGGTGILLNDENDDIKSILFAYRYNEHDDPPTGQPHDYTEYGTSMSLIPGYNSGQMLMAVLALREWWESPPERYMMNCIETNNGPSMTTYRDRLGWETITDPAELEILFPASYRHYDQDYGTGMRKPPPRDKWDEVSFLKFTDASLALHARMLLAFMDQGGLFNKKTRHAIPVDFSAVDEAGLTRPRLEAMAAGETSRDSLIKIGDPKP